MVVSLRNLLSARVTEGDHGPKATRARSPFSSRGTRTPNTWARITHPYETDPHTPRRPYLSATQLDQRLGPSLNKEQRTALYGKLFVHINLNTASREEILLIPGMGPRMAHEFEEYRPYRSFEQFRKEMGKYVDAKEVARLERYVTIATQADQAK